MIDNINPNHYKWHPVAECIDISEHFSKNIGSAIEYLWRQGRKGDAIEDLQKAIWFIERQIRFLNIYYNNEKPEEFSWSDCVEGLTREDIIHADELGYNTGKGQAKYCEDNYINWLETNRCVRCHRTYSGSGGLQFDCKGNEI